jgi:type IV pilus assembly protein PilW
MVMCDALVVQDLDQNPDGTESCNRATQTYTNVEVIVPDVVDFQVQYGVSNAANDEDVGISEWVDATGNWDSAVISNADIARVVAIRYALVVRSPLPEKDEVSPSEIKLWADESSPDSVGPVFDVPDRHYRYKVFQTITPMRNVLGANPT